LLIAASEDGTEVSLRTPASPDQRETIRLAAGQLVQFIARGDEDLSGRPIISNKPIALFGGSPCFVRDTRIGCDSGHQQIPAVSALGHEYVAAPHGDRFPTIREAHTWKIVGAVAGTQLTYLPVAPPQAPQSLTTGQVVEFTSSASFVIRSQDKDHPFYIAQYMSGCGAVATGPNCQGDPEFVNVLPAAQFLSSYTFFADPTYSETHLVVVRARGQDNRFSDVKLGCAAAPIANWKPVGDYEVANVDLVTGDFVPVIPGCDNGRLVMNSAAPFGITVWGWGSSLRGKTFVSYAYPAGTAARVVNNVIVE
jgi:hypothetical protein